MTKFKSVMKSVTRPSRARVRTGCLLLAKLRSDLNPANDLKKVRQGLLDCATSHSNVSGTTNEPYQCVLNDSLGSFKETEEKEEVKNAILLAFIDIISVSHL